MELIVHDGSTTRDVAVAKIIARLISESDAFTFGLAGGSTPRGIYERLRGMAVGWEKVDAFLGDERWVPPDDERSNGRMAEEALFAHVPATLHRPRYSENLTPGDSASYYEADLRSFIDDGPDLILLGMGPDRHTASLFPESPALEEKQRWFVANPINSEVRLTTTLPFLHRARRLLFVANGDDKAEALADVFTPGSDAPSAQAARGGAVVEWHVDDSAARLVES